MIKRYELVYIHNDPAPPRAEIKSVSHGKYVLLEEVKQSLIKSMVELIESKDPSYDERVIWALEEAMDLIEGTFP